MLVAALRLAEVNQSAKAASFVTLSLPLGGSVASAALVTLVDRRSQWHQTTLAGSIAAHLEAISSYLRRDTVTQLAAIVQGEAQTLAYADAFLS